MKRLTRGLACALLLAGLWLAPIAEPIDSPPEPKSDDHEPPKVGGGADMSTTAPASPAAPARTFRFETESGKLSEAMTILLGRNRGFGKTEEEASARFREIAAARASLRASAKEAATKLVAELKTLDPEDLAGHAALLDMLSEVATEPPAIEYLRAQVMTGQPSAPQNRKGSKSKIEDQPVLPDADQSDPRVRIRALAMIQLYTAAEKGAEPARVAILDGAASPHSDVRVLSVQLTYGLSKSRLQSRNELRKRLPAAEQHLLYRY